jgi:hypothetical protein
MRPPKGRNLSTRTKMSAPTPVGSDTLGKVLSDPGLEQRSLDPAEIPRPALAEAVQAYLSAIPHHMRASEPIQCEISKAWEFRFYRVVVSILVETRTVARQRVPYRGWNIPTKAKDETNINAWSYSMPRKTLDDTLEPKTSIVADSQSLHDCTRCSVTGWLDCQGCGAKGRVTCTGCNGQGSFTCTACAGAGQITKTRVVVRQEKCKNCAINTVANILAVFDDNPYTRARACRTCGGSGIRQWKEDEQHTVDCRRCQTTGKEACKPCKTTGLVTCNGCTGKGEIGCPDCDKCKRVVSYLSVTQEHRTLTAEEGAIPDLFTESISHDDSRLFRAGASQPVFEDTAESVVLVPYESAASTANVAGQIGRKSCGLVKKTRDGKPKESRIVQERVVLFQGLSYGFQYLWQGKGYKAVSRPVDALTGKPTGLVSHVSPATRWLCEQMRESQALADSGDTRESALLLGRCKEVAACDHVCAQYLREGISKLPEKVLEMSDKVMFTFTQILFFSSAAGIVLVGLCLGFLLNIVFPAILAAFMAVVFLMLGIMFGRSQADVASNKGVWSSAMGLLRRRK